MAQMPMAETNDTWHLCQKGCCRVMLADHAITLKVPRSSDPILAEIVRRLVEAYSPERIYLFGSVAREEAGPDGDYDLMMIVPDDAPPERLRSRLAYRALRGTGTAVDIVIWPKSSFERPARVADRKSTRLNSSHR